MKYPVAERALKKWQSANLDKTELAENMMHYTFRFNGSTCNNGGVEYTALLHARITAEGTIKRAWIEIPAEEEASASQMCACPGSDSVDSRGFFETLARDASFSGRSLEDVIAEEVPLNHAGCLCYPPHDQSEMENGT